MSGSTVELDIELESRSDVAAIAFAVDFDTSRLKCSSSAEQSAVAPNLAIEVPPGFKATSFFMPGANGRIGVAIYDAVEPIDAIPAGRIAKLRFDTLAGSSGHAYVRIASDPAPNAAGTDGRLIAWNGSSTGGGVTITTRRAELTISPQTLRFGAVAMGDRVERTLLLSNTGTAALQIGAVRLSGDTSFALIDSPSGAIEPNATLPLRVAFEGRSSGSHAATIEIDIDGSSPLTRHVSVLGEVAADGAVVYDSRWLVPAAARITSADGSRWQTSLVLVNGGTRAADVRLTLFGSARALADATLRVTPGATLAYSDIVSDLFKLGDASGFVLIESSSPDLIARSATSNVFAAGAELGQSVPVLAWEQLLHGPEVGWLVGLSRSASRRSNVSLMNAGASDAVIRVALRRSDGSIIGERDYLIPPMLAVLGIDIFDALAISDSDNISASITCLTEQCVYFAYASTVKQGSAPIFQSVR